MPFTAAQYRQKAEDNLSSAEGHVMNSWALQTDRSVAATSIGMAWAYLYEVQKRIDSGT